MNKYKEYKKKLKSVHIDNHRGFHRDMNEFFEKNPDIKIITTIVHQPYHVTIIYEIKIPV